MVSTTDTHITSLSSLSPLSSPHSHHFSLLSLPLSSPSSLSYLAAMLQSSDYRVVVGAIQMASTLLQKQPAVFLVHFHREGVIHAMEALKEVPLQALVTPKKSEEHLKLSVPLASSSGRGEVVAPRSESASDSPSSARRYAVLSTSSEVAVCMLLLVCLQEICGYVSTK